VDPPPPRDLYRRGLDLYNRGLFFESHEALEELWRAAPPSERLFLQSLIHFAVAFHHHQRKNPTGAARQLRKALRKLAGYLPAHGGLNTAALYREGQAALGSILQGRPLHTYPALQVPPGAAALF